MIAYLEGKLAEKSPTLIVLDVHGVGYEVHIPLSTYDRLPAPDGNCRVLIYDHIREDSRTLFGFVRQEDREMFARLLSITGIGPKLALSALSGLSVRDLKSAVVNGDVKRISSISGIGKKMAERIVMELRDKLSDGEVLEASTGIAEAEGDVRLRDGMMALVSLGYKQADAARMVRRAMENLGPDATVEEVIRRSFTG